MRKFLVVLFTLAPLSGVALAADDAAAPPPDKAKGPEHKITQSPSFMMIDPIYTTIVGDARADGLLMVGVGLDIPDAALRDEVTRSMPVLRDAYVRNLMAYTATNVRIDTQPDVGMIADRLQAVTDRALHHKGARILLAQVALRASK